MCENDRTVENLPLTAKIGHSAQHWKFHDEYLLQCEYNIIFIKFNYIFTKFINLYNILIFIVFIITSGFTQLFVNFI